MMHPLQRIMIISVLELARQDMDIKIKLISELVDAKVDGLGRAIPEKLTNSLVDVLSGLADMVMDVDALIKGFQTEEDPIECKELELRTGRLVEKLEKFQDRFIVDIYPLNPNQGD